MPVLSLLIFLPLVFGAALLPFLNVAGVRVFRISTLVCCGIQLLISTYIFTGASFQNGGINNPEQFQWTENHSWLDINLGSPVRLQANYLLGVDGLSAGMVWLSGIVMFIGALASFNIKKSEKGYYLLYLLLSSAVFGCFLALDFLLFYLFFEFMLLPMYFLIGIWGGERREYAAIKFFLYTLFGSLLILLGMVGLCMSTGWNADGQITHTFSLISMADSANFLPGSLLHPDSNILILGIPARKLAFLLLFIGFAVKLPVIPLHTWLPDAHVEAPTPVSAVLAGILLKIGGYGLMRIPFSIFPEQVHALAWGIGLLGVACIVYAGLCALAMHDLKKMVAYSSISHLGFVVLGLASCTPEGIAGAQYQMFSHGIISALLFLLVGVFYDRTHDRTIENFGGLYARIPAYTALLAFALFASLGLPAFSGFIAELLVLLGAFSASVNNAEHGALLSVWMAPVAATGIILAAGYWLWTLQRMFFGKLWARNGEEMLLKLTPMKPIEWLCTLPLAALTLFFGLFPQVFLNRIAGATEKLASIINAF
ncbi:MAG: NADH-quinone oxidoreductase subunit M [Bacteroidota bacterium]